MTFYESIAEWYDDIFQTPAAQVNFITGAMNGLEGKEMADIGCGTGNLSIHLASRAKKITGVDLDSGMLDKARKKGASFSNLSFVQGDMLKINEAFEPATLDGLVCIGNTLVHLPGPKKLLSFLVQCAQVLKPDGTLIIQTINYDHILDDGVDKLPSIENEQIHFDRTYELREQDELINFKTKLTIKSNDQLILNSVPLFPLRRELLNQLLKEAGFVTQKYYGDFQGNSLQPQSLQMILKATM